MAIVCRGAGYGSLAGAVSGALVGVVLAFQDPSLLAIMIASALTGGTVGLAVGILGGILFASAAPCLARHAGAARLAGASLVPGILAVGIGTFARGNAPGFVADTGRVLALLSALGIAGGALTGPRVLYGKSPRTPVDGGAPPPGGDGADSPE
jgi:hypothetical protein